MAAHEKENANTETMRVTTRGYELAQTGVVPLSAYLRYLEHQRWTAIARSDRLPIRRFFAMGVVRAQGLQIHEQVGFNEELELTMWVSRLGRTSLTFSHDVTKVSTGTLVARSSATVVALDVNRRPAAIDSAAEAYVVQRESLELDRLAFDVPENAFRKSIEVRPSDQDLQRHVNHARYADFVEDTRYFAAEAGAYGNGLDAFPSRFFLAYEREARVGEPLSMTTWTSSEKTLDFALIKDDGTLVTRARIGL